MNYFPNPRWEARKAAIERGEVAEPTRTPIPCIHIGDEIPASAAAQMGLSPQRKWRLCNRGYVAAVCDCAEGRDPWCGPACPGYSAPVRASAPTPES